MNNNNNIEDLFRNTLDNYQVDVKPELWKAIQSKLPVGNAAGGASAAKGVVAGAKISASSIIIAASVVVISAVSLLVFNSGNKKPEVKKLQTIEQPVVSAFQTENDKVNSVSAVPAINSSDKSVQNKPKTELTKAVATTKITYHQNISKSSFDSQSSNTASKEGTSASTPSNTNNGSIVEENKVAASSQSNPGNISDKKEEQSPTDANSDDASGVGSDTKQSATGKPLDISEYFGQIPNTFSPNFDGKNDLFMVHPKDIKSFTVTIFDRSGKQIHQWSNPNGFWDGLMSNGQEAPTGSYYYLIVAETTDGQSIKTKLSSLTLFR